MDYYFSYYRGRFVYDAKEYLGAIRAGFFNIVYDAKNRKKMLNEIEKLIDYNSSVDLYAYAHLLFDDGSSSSIDKAYNILDIIVSWNYIPAKHLLGQMYFYGIGVHKDYKKFYELTLEAANCNFMLSKNALALAYFNGYGCNIDYQKGQKLLEECIDAHYGMAFYNIGIGYLKGTCGYPKDIYKAFNYLKQAADQFNSKALYNVGLMYIKGDGCVKDVKKGLNELMTAASIGHLKSQIKAADSYYFGEITQKNYELAYEYYLMAAEAGDAYAMYSVGYMIVNKEKSWVERYVGIDWLRKAADLGYEAAKELLKKI